MVEEQPGHGLDFLFTHEVCALLLKGAARFFRDAGIHHHALLRRRGDAAVKGFAEKDIFHCLPDICAAFDERRAVAGAAANQGLA